MERKLQGIIIKLLPCHSDFPPGKINSQEGCVQRHYVDWMADNVLLLLCHNSTETLPIHDQVVSNLAVVWSSGCDMESLLQAAAMDGPKKQAFYVRKPCGKLTESLTYPS